MDAVRTLMEDPRDVPDTGSARDDVEAILLGLAERLRSGHLADVAPALVAAVDADPQLGELMEVYVQCRREPMRTVLRRGVERGELRADLDVDLAVDLCAGPLFYRRLVARRPAGPEDVEALVDLVFAGIGRDPAPPVR
jgi:hypothetical protein